MISIRLWIPVCFVAAAVAQTPPPAPRTPRAAPVVAPAAPLPPPTPAADLDAPEPPIPPAPAIAPVADQDLTPLPPPAAAPDAVPEPPIPPAPAIAPVADQDLTPPPPPPPAAPAPQAVPAPAAAPAPPAMHMLLGRPVVDAAEIAQQVREQIDQIDMSAVQDQVNQSLKNLDLNLNFDFNFDKMDMLRDQADMVRDQADMAREQAELAREKAEMDREQAGGQFDMLRGNLKGQVADAMELARDKMAMARDQLNLKGFAFAQQTPMPPMPAMPAMPSPKVFTMRGRPGSVDGLYQRGLSALDNHRYDQALDDFTEVATRAGAHADGALYWKAYTLNKLGRRDDANAALAELRKSYASSHWLDDAKALEIEVKQSSGQKVSPESESNDELKLLALEGLVQSDPDRAYPILDKLLKGPQSPNLKKRAIYVLALSNSPRGQQLLEQIARGGGNPDLQMTAIQYLGSRGSKDANKSNVLYEIYNASTDANVKRGVLNALVSNRDKDHLLQIAKNDKSPDMRQDAVRMLGSMAAQPEMWALYQSETDPDVKRAILDYVGGSTDKLIEIAKTEKDAKLRRSAIQRLASVKTTATSDALVQIYGAEQDQQVKRSIIDALYNQRNVPALVAVGHKEPDPEMKKTIVHRMLDLPKSSERDQFLEEILK